MGGWEAPYENADVMVQHQERWSTVCCFCTWLLQYASQTWHREIWKNIVACETLNLSQTYEFNLRMGQDSPCPWQRVQPFLSTGNILPPMISHLSYDKEGKVGRSVMLVGLGWRLYNVKTSNNMKCVCHFTFVISHDSVDALVDAMWFVWISHLCISLVKVMTSGVLRHKTPTYTVFFF